MQQAYDLALQAKACGEVPVGAVLVDANGQKLGEGCNQVIAKKDPCAHAEILAIRQAASALGNYRLLNSTLYITLEPCPMCAGAIVQARIGRIVFAVRDLKSGAAGSVYNLLKGKPLNHKVLIDEGVMEMECQGILTHFFKGRR